MTRTYEIMFLIDNNAVRAGWKEAKASVTGLIEKHGGKVLTARRWDERKLAYPVKRRRRGTYLLAYAELAGTGVSTLRRELDLTENVLRYLALLVESVPAQEFELGQAELASDFRVPEPPPEDAVPVTEEESADADEGAEEGALAEAEVAGEEV